MYRVHDQDRSLSRVDYQDINQNEYQRKNIITGIRIYK